MYYWYQLILAARNNTDEDAGWMQLLVFIIMVVFWALGSLIKKKPVKPQMEDDQQLEETIVLQRRASRSPIFQPAPKRVTPTWAPTPQPDRVQQKTRLNIPPEQTKPQPIPPAQDELQSLTTAVQTPKPSPNFLLDLTNPHNLKTAILYHEILGAPLSLRERPTPLYTTSDKPAKTQRRARKKQ